MNRLSLLCMAFGLGACGNSNKADDDAGEIGYINYDSDGDGVINRDDCADGDPEISPEAQEVCDGIDNDCDGDIDEGTNGLQTWYFDEDGDGYGDLAQPIEACEAPEGTVDNGDDCDDADPEVFPDAPERCDDLDNDCDGDVDEDLVQVWYADADGDGFGDVEDSITECDPAEGWVDGSSADFDCDDADPAINPDATEICNAIDDDCDGDIDDADADLDASTGSTWYTDADEDGYGDASSSTESCDQPSGTVADDSDCDDGDSDINPGESDTWYDGTDSDCDGASDYDADGDGDDSEVYGGGDCDDTDASVYEGEGCRPEAGCTSPDTTTLASNDPSGGADIQFDADCVAWVPTVINGTDYVYAIDSSGYVGRVRGYSNYNIPAIAVDPGGGGELAAASNDNAAARVGIGSTSVSYATGSAWANTYMNRGHSSIAWDSSDLIWVPNIAGNGTFGSIDYSTGTSSTLASSLGTRVESVALDSDEAVYISLDDEIYEIDTSTGITALYQTAGGTVLDMVFDYNDDLYVETDADEIELFPGDGSASSVYDTVSGDGKLAISPDGVLFRIQVNPVSAASYDSWDLD